MLLRHLAITHAEHVHPPDVPAVPAVTPTLDDPVSGGEGLLRFKARGTVAEDRPPGESHRGAPFVAHPVGSRARGIEDTVVGQESHSGIEIMRRPRRSESLDNGY